MQPRLLMLDEVNAGLNPTEIDEALGMIRKIAEQGVTIIVIEHLMKVVLSISHRVVGAAPRPVDRPGRAARVVSDKRVIEAYLGAKYAAAKPGGACIERRAKAFGHQPAGRLRRRAGAVGYQSRGRRGRARLYRRLERRRQDHADALPLRAAQAVPPVASRSTAKPMTQAPPADFVRAGIAHVPEGRRLFSAMSVHDNLLMGAYLRTTRTASPRIWSASMRCSRFSPSGSGRTPARCRAASSRCARSGAA